jgi:hypothetical protein
MNALEPMMQFMTFLPPLRKMLVSTWDENNYICFLQSHSTPFVNKLTLCLPKLAFALSQHYHCWPNTNGFISPILHNSKICCLQCNLSQAKELLQLTPHWSIPPLSNWSIWLLTQTCRCVFTQLCQCHLEFKRDKKPSSFYLGHFSLSNFFYHITKDTNVFHLKSSGNHRLNYFPTSIPSKHTSCHHGQSIANHWFLTYKYDRPSIGSRLWTWRDFHSYFEPIWHLVISPFSFILLLYTFP